jgi:EAL and modified HD-GYP domain-containing signal transduction protein
MEIFIARQPIFDSEYRLYAYELLYRESLENVFSGHLSDNVATSLLLMHSYFSFGLNNLVGDSKAFINFDKNLIGHDVAQLLNHDQVVIELLETVVPDPAFLKKIGALKDQGYTIAIDDYVKDYPHQEMVQIADLIKIDFFENSKEDIRAIVKDLKAMGKKLLAEKVESKEMFLWAKDLGFDYFQGFYFEKPSVQKHESMSQNGVQYVRVMSELNNDEPDYKKLSEIILTDVSLTYKLLKVANANAKPISPIKTIPQALAVLGVKRFRKWLSLAMVQNLSEQETSELVKYGLIRSALLQSIADHSSLKRHQEELSLMGILSIVDGILKMDMTKALEPLPIDPIIKDTLLNRKTSFSSAMGLCFAYEKGKFDHVESFAKEIGYDLNLLPDHYVQAISWTDKMLRELKA